MDDHAGQTWIFVQIPEMRNNFSLFFFLFLLLFGNLKKKFILTVPTKQQVTFSMDLFSVNMENALSVPFQHFVEFLDL